MKRTPTRGRSRRIPDPIAALPFVGPRSPDKPGSFPRDFWKVPDGGGDHLGFDYALAFLRYTAAQDHNLHPYILAWIVSDMPAELTQIEIGFLTIIESAAISGLQEAERLSPTGEALRSQEK